MIHETLQALADTNYTGDTSLIGASAGAAAIFVYLNRLDQGQYAGSDAQISSFIAMDAPTKNIADAPSQLECVPYCSVLSSSETAETGWDGDVRGAADYVRKHGIGGVYAWATNDMISSKVDGGGAWSLVKTYASSGSAHEFVESSPTSTGQNLLSFLP